MTIKKFEINMNEIEKAGKPRIGKPYSQQMGRKSGEGAGKIVSKDTKQIKTYFGIQVDPDAKKSIRGKLLGSEALASIKSGLKQFETSNPNDLDNMIANTNQNLSNKQIAAAYSFLGIGDKMKNTNSVKRAK